MNGTSLLREPAGGGRPDAVDDCEVFEPAIAALADGALGERGRERLARHLAGCAACREVTGRVTLFRAELDDIPEPRPPRAVAASDPAPPGVPASPSAGAAAGGAPGGAGVAGGAGGARGGARGGGGPGGRGGPAPPWGGAAAGGAPWGARIAGAFVAPRGFRLVWALELALVGIGAALLASATSGRPAVDRELAPIELRARRAEERAAAAERRAESAEALAGSAASMAARVEALEEQVESSRRDARETPERPRVPAPALAPKGSEPPATAPGAAEAPGNEAPSAVQQEPRAPGMLTVVCAPFCDEVLDGTRTLGPSPIVRLPVAPGRHLLTLKKAGMADKKLAVEVVSGQVSAMRVQMK